jgi:hypothetical protein
MCQDPSSIRNTGCSAESCTPNLLAFKYTEPNCTLKINGCFGGIGTVGGEVQLGPLGTAAINRPIVPAPGDYDDGEIGAMIGRRNRSTRRKPAPVPLRPPKTPHDARTRTQAAAVGSRRLTA